MHHRLAIRPTSCPTKTLLAAGLLVLAAFACTAQAGERRVALVIGNGAYKYNTVLKNPANDAADLAAALRRNGFAVTSLLDAGRVEMERAIRDFGNALKDPEAVGLFFYSGHGAQAEGQNYLLPVDADIQAADEVAYKAVDAEAVLAKMRSAGNRLNIVVLDACRNNPFPGASKSGERGLAVVRVKVPESVIVYATDPGATAADGEGRNSPFTRAFLTQMETPGQDITIMMKRVTSAVREGTRGAQTPWVSSNLSVDFAFRPGGAPAAAAASAPPARAAATGTMTVEAAHGAIRVTVATSCRVYVDGADKGELPAGGSGTISGVTAGSRSLEVRYADGRTERATVAVEKDRTASAAFSYRPAPPPSQAPEGFVLVEAGSFQMGSTDGENDEKPVHAVTLSRSFYMSRTEVTQRQWREVMGGSPSKFKGDDLPVESVSWYNAVEFCNLLSKREGLQPCYTIDKTRRDPINQAGDVIVPDSFRWIVTCDFAANGYRLPTEAEWEYAARGGSAARGTPTREATRQGRWAGTAKVATAPATPAVPPTR